MRNSVTIRIAASAMFVVAALVAQAVIPELPRFIALLPAVVVSAFLGGPWVGAVALVFTTFFAGLDLVGDRSGTALRWGFVGLGLFVAGGAFAIATAFVRDRAVGRLRLDRERLEAALAAANAAVWEMSPDRRLSWDENFFRLVGLAPRAEPPSAAEFLAMVHPDDRKRLAEARRLMDAGQTPSALDEYRLVRADGTTIWLENHRARAGERGDYHIGITQDVTRRKVAEERVRSILREASHRARNQFTVISAVARETSRRARSADEFEETFSGRLAALARSHDLLVVGQWNGADLRELLVAHLEPFGAADRVAIEGREVTLSPSSVQYLGMAFHELATNAVKHGALSVPSGAVHVSWSVAEAAGDPEFSLTWSETGGPATDISASKGFGTQVLTRLVPDALSGSVTRDVASGGLVWILTAPLSAVRQAEGQES